MAKGLSLHIGLNKVDANHYAGWDGTLNACEADAQDMRVVADRQHFKTGMLLTKDATRKAVTEAINDASKKLVAGDTFMITFSGHGGQVPDLSRDEADARDETWCLYDGQIVDDELALHWKNFADGVRIVVVADCCHGGTVTKENLCRNITTRNMAVATGTVATAPPMVRMMPMDVARRTYVKNQKMYDGLQRKKWRTDRVGTDIKASVLLLGACQDNQLAYDGVINGLFTSTLLNVWREGHFEGNYRVFHRRIVDQMPPEQTPNYFVVGKPDMKFENQKPFTIGTGAKEKW